MNYNYFLMPENIINLIVAIVILLFGLLLSKAIRVIILNTFSKAKIGQIYCNFVAKLFSVVFLSCSFIVALNYIGVHTTSIAAILGAFSVAFGLAFQSSLSNFSSGMLILFTHPFSKGDDVDCAGVRGIITEIDLIVTRMRTKENKIITIPNNKIMSGIIINNSTILKRSIELFLTFSNKNNINQVIENIKNELKSSEGMIDDIEPKIYISSFSESYTELSVKFWVNEHCADQFKSQFICNIRKLIDNKIFQGTFTTKRILSDKNV